MEEALTVEDLSHLAVGVVGQSSMGGSNTLSVPPAFAPPGSESEATQGIETHSVPEPDLGSQEDYARFQHSGGDDAFAGYGATEATHAGDSPDLHSELTATWAASHGRTDGD